MCKSNLNEGMNQYSFICLLSCECQILLNVMHTYLMIFMDSVLVQLDMEEMKKDYHVYGYSKHVKTIAEHYGVYKDLFGMYTNFLSFM